MAIRFILTDYVSRAMNHAVYYKLEDGSFAGRIPPCLGVVAFGSTLSECEAELRSTLEDWILIGLKLGNTLPVIHGIDLNKEPRREPVGIYVPQYRSRLAAGKESATARGAQRAPAPRAGKGQADRGVGQGTIPGTAVEKAKSPGGHQPNHSL